MNVLVDTNVLISAVIRDRLPQRVVDEIVSRDDWFWIVTAEIEKEYREVLARPKFNVPDAIQLSWRAFIEEVTVRVEPSSHPAFPRDPKDESPRSQRRDLHCRSSCQRCRLSSHRRQRPTRRATPRLDSNSAACRFRSFVCDCLRLFALCALPSASYFPLSLPHILCIVH
jgi:hypothetical protein